MKLHCEKCIIEPSRGTRKQGTKKEGSKDMKPVYVGKMVNGTLQICKVIDSDIATGDAIVFNRATKKVETLKYAEKHTLYQNVRKLAEDTPEFDCGY